MVMKLIPVLGSQPVGDVSHKPGGRLPLLSARPAVTLATLKSAATSFAAWWTEARWMWTVCLRLLPDSVAAAIWTQALLRLSPALWTLGYRATMAPVLKVLNISLNELYPTFGLYSAKICFLCFMIKTRFVGKYDNDWSSYGWHKQAYCHYSSTVRYDTIRDATCIFTCAQKPT